MSKVTRILYTTSDQNERIEAMCSVAGFIRADIWRRYGGLGTIGTTVSDIRKEINAKQLYTHLPIDGTVRAETTKDVLNDIYLAKASANERRTRTRNQCRDIAYQSAHALVDQAKLIIAEDLSTPMASKHHWKNYNRRMSSWAKGILSRALTEVTAYRNAHLHLVNAAYTSQMDSTTQLLEGKRVGDKFYCANGDVLHADTNAALNILARYYDEEISRYMPYQQVRKILLKRSIGGTDRQGLELHATL